MKQGRSIGQRFDARAAQYDNPLTDYIGERELRQVRTLIPSGSRVLDYGCGTGRTALDLLHRACIVTAYDLSPGMLALAVARSRQLGYAAEWTSHAADLAGRQWPVVACIGVLDYYPDPVPLLQTLVSHLAPAGQLVITVPNGLSPLAWAYGLASRFTVPAQPRTPGFMRTAAKRAGLRVCAQRFAFPTQTPLGLTLILKLEPRPAVPNTGS
jgi:2-polyprenyl-3-methyl-5-hydroxy-6-metoxy-1,4-benzoquinol methylase